MSDTLASLQHKIAGAGELQSVVRTMKALAASSIGQYERAVTALSDYYRTVELGLIACLQEESGAIGERRRNNALQDVKGEEQVPSPRKPHLPTTAVVFGSDQGLVGQFNELLADFVKEKLDQIPGDRTLLAVGERVQGRLTDIGLPPASLFAVPNSVTAITPLVSQLLITLGTGSVANEPWPETNGHAMLQPSSHGPNGRLPLTAGRWPLTAVLIFHNQLRSGAICEPVCSRLLPLDEEWRQQLTERSWPTRTVPQVLHDAPASLPILVREYLFVSLYRACAESLASENSSRLAAMQRAEKNIDELLENLTQTFHRLRQSSIDEELFDVISGYESLRTQNRNPCASAEP